MKTAISVEGDLLEKADEVARKMGLSRSRLFSLALRDYLEQLNQEEILERLNRAYADSPDTERRMAAKIKTKMRSTIKDRW